MLLLPGLGSRGETIHRTYRFVQSCVNLTLHPKCVKCFLSPWFCLWWWCRFILQARGANSRSFYRSQVLHILRGIGPERNFHSRASKKWQRWFTASSGNAGCAINHVTGTSQKVFFYEESIFIRFFVLVVTRIHSAQRSMLR